MDRLSTQIIALLLSALAGAASAETLVIVNPANGTAALDHRQLVDIYMGRNLKFPDGQPALVLDQGPESRIRRDFYSALIGKSVAEVNAYWARLLFTGRAAPPRPMDDASEVLETVRENRNAIGYVDSADVDESVKVVARVE